MKKTLLTLAVALGLSVAASAQVLPSFQFGVKAGANLTSVSNNLNTLSASNQAGYLAGFWARVGGLGFNFQPELYLTSKNVNVSDNSGNTVRAKFTSIDVPLLFGARVGAVGIGGRFYTGPLISFAVNKDQSFSNAAADAFSLKYKDQNYAWQIGAGVDLRKLSFDLRYEAGLNKVVNNYGGSTRINLFNLTVGYRLFGL